MVDHYCVWANHDLRIALAGALGGDAGIVIVAGTGSAAYGRTEDGQSWQAGGWGWLMDDPGSGYWLGRRALRAIAEEADDRGKPTSLTNLIVQQMGLNSIRELRDKLYGPKKTVTPIQKITGLAPLVTSAAEDGDQVAKENLERGLFGNYPHGSGSGPQPRLDKCPNPSFGDWRRGAKWKLFCLHSGKGAGRGFIQSNPPATSAADGSRRRLFGF